MLARADRCSMRRPAATLARGHEPLCDHITVKHHGLMFSSRWLHRDVISQTPQGHVRPPSEGNEWQQPDGIVMTAKIKSKSWVKCYFSIPCFFLKKQPLVKTFKKRCMDTVGRDCLPSRRAMFPGAAGICQSYLSLRNAQQVSAQVLWWEKIRKERNVTRREEGCAGKFDQASLMSGDKLTSEKNRPGFTEQQRFDLQKPGPRSLRF